jgi:putative ATP-dependent endonuclease of OLD family
LTRLTIENLRSVSAQVQIEFPSDGPLVILGENNAGKSNVVRAIDILFGERYPKNYPIEDHDFHGRDSDGIAIEIHASIEDMPCNHVGGSVTHIRWIHDAQNPTSNGDPVNYSMSCMSCSKSYLSNEIRSSLFAMPISADRRLDYQLSYASKFTLLSKLMHRFHTELISDPLRRQRLQGIFSNLLEEFTGVKQYKVFRDLLAVTAEEFGQNLSYRLDIDFSAYDPSNFFRSLRVHPKLDGEARSFDELGTGQEQILALAFSYAYAKAFGQHSGLILVIDEPESNLHPLAQQWLAARLNHLATDGLQIVLTTHSPYFVDLSRPENLVVVRRPDAGPTQLTQVSRTSLVSQLIQSGSDKERTTVASIGEFYAAAATTELVSALFSRLCVLVEGDTEAFAIPEFLRLMEFDPLKRGVSVVSAGGIGNIAKWRRLLTAYGVPVYCIFDTDAGKTGRDATNLHLKRADIFAALGRDPSEADSDRLSSDPLYIADEYATFNSNFEIATKAVFGDRWEAAHEAAAEIVGDSKPLRARYAARVLKREDLGPEAVGALRALVDALSNLLPRSAASAQSLSASDLSTPAQSGDPWARPAAEPFAAQQPDPWASPQPAPTAPDPWASADPWATAEPDPWERRRREEEEPPPF